MYLAAELGVPFPFLIIPQPSVENEASLFIFPYAASTDYGLAANLLPNDVYASAPFHPTGKKVGSFGVADNTLTEPNDQRQADYIYTDHTYTVRNFHEQMKTDYRDPPTNAYPAVVASPMAGTIAYESSLAGTGHHWGYASCEWLRHCDSMGAVGPKEYVGSQCSVTRRKTIISGYCFESDNGSMECGRTIDVTDKFDGITQMTHDSGPGQGVNRCPRGTPATGLGTAVTKRLLIGGCMLAGDQNFTQTAEVHVPQMCAVPTDYHKGCMFPGATNYDPNAKQPANCFYLTNGCTDSTAVNFNAEASIADGSCIAATYGCTVQPYGYTEVDSETPMYKKRFVGVPARSVGREIWATYTSVTNYKSDANVLQGCKVAIEGCTDTSAINYDPAANLNSRTWCVPSVPGCMMPPTGYPSLNYLGSGARAHQRDGLAINFNPAATVHDPTKCTLERFGCTDSKAFNYDPHATVDYGCYAKTPGCLDPNYDNYNCSSSCKDVTTDDGAVVCVAITAKCTDESPRVTTHNQAICSATAPSAPPIDPFEEVDTVEAKSDMTIAEEISECTFLLGTWDSMLNSGSSTCAATAGSTNIVISTPMASLAAYNAFSAKVSTTFPSIASLNSAFGVTALTVPTVTAVITYKTKSPDSDNSAAVIGGAVGGTLGGLLLIAIIVVTLRKKSTKVEA